jgi:hypothetical protein
MLSRVFCSMTSCGWISTLKRREVWNRRSSTRPNEISLQRPVEDRFADGADRGLELVDAGIGRRPAGFDVRHRDALVVARKKARKFCAR